MTDTSNNLLAATIPTQTTFFGASIPSSFSNVVAPNGTTIDLAHVWKAGADGLFHPYDTTTGQLTDLATEWMNSLKAALAGGPMTSLQHSEANAEVLFQNTTLHTLSAATQTRDMEDMQREFDAIAAAQKVYQTQVPGYDPGKPFDQASYLGVETALQDNAQLLELAIQGHGLNSPSAARYDGYTNDFQNNVDTKTVFIGGGLDNNQNALTNLADDSILTHITFPTVAQNGHLEQLNQNGNPEDQLKADVLAADDAMYDRLYTSADFSQNTSAVNDKYVSPDAKMYAADIKTAGAGQIVTFFGDVISSTLSSVAVPGTATVQLDHNWVANSQGLFEAVDSKGQTINLAAEWQADYATMLAGNGASLTAEQRMEGNAEAVFENTGLSKLSAAQQNIDRLDAQREFDAIGAAMKINAETLGISASAQFTQSSYLALERTLQANASLKELAIQGHGLNNPSSSRYAGYTNDFQNNVDNTTLYVGGGPDDGQKAIADFFDDVALTHVPFPTVAQNGHLEQLNQNGNSEQRIGTAVAGLNESAFQLTLHSTDFYNSKPVTVAGFETTLTGDQIANEFRTVTTGIDPSATQAAAVTASLPHTWLAGTDGLFHIVDSSIVNATGNEYNDLMAEWQASFDIVAAGGGNVFQHSEANALVLFQNTALHTLSATVQLRDMEDMQREFDAISAAQNIYAEITPGYDPSKPFDQISYLGVGQVLQDNAQLEELAIQGHGLNSPSNPRYNGYTNDFQNNVDKTTLFIGGGLDNNQNALRNLADDSIITHLPFPVVPQNGHLEQLNQNGNPEDRLETDVLAANDSMYDRLYTKADFSQTTSTANNKYVSPDDAAYDKVEHAAPPAGDIKTFYGYNVTNNFSTITLADGFGIDSPHHWVADATGLFHAYDLTSNGSLGSPANLKAEWQGYMKIMQAGGASTLTFEQRQEGNAEIIFENTGLSKLSADVQARDREDAQREFDAINMAAQINQHVLGISMNAAFTTKSYLALERTLQGNPLLEELALQGHGLNHPSSPRYNGYTNDFQNNVDTKTVYVGGGFDTGENAVAALFDDAIMTHIPFPTVAQNGHLEQLNQNGAAEDRLPQAVAGVDDLAFYRVLKASDFRVRA